MVTWCSVRSLTRVAPYTQKKLLADGVLKLPYIYIAALPDMPNVAADMVEYPAPRDTATTPKELTCCSP